MARALQAGQRHLLPQRHRSEETLLLLFPDAVDAKDRRSLFVRETRRAAGDLGGRQFAEGSDGTGSGIPTVLWTSATRRRSKRLVRSASTCT
ncbi:MAG: hypothetical protein IPO90_16065 [Flavobacteriales bacterium]|nr:hypothetical protein [Flavobacteriales bacterium]